MTNDLSFQRINEAAGKPVNIKLDGKAVSAIEGENLAAALLAAGERHFRQSASTGQPRGPWCLMGSCYECVVEVDGVAVQACMTTVSDGMQIARRQRLPDLHAAPAPHENNT